MKRNLILFIATICTLALAVFGLQVFAAGTDDLYYYNGEMLYFDMHNLKMVESTSSGGDIRFGASNYIIGVNGASIKDMGTMDFDKAKVPTLGYSSDRVDLKQDHTYAVRCSDGSYGIIKITSYDSNEGSAEFIARHAEQEISATTGTTTGVTTGTTTGTTTGAVAGTTTGAVAGTTTETTTETTGTISGTTTETTTQTKPVANIKTNISELYWVESGSRFVMGGKIIFEDSKGIYDAFLSPNKKYVVYSNGLDNLLMYDIGKKTKKSIYELGDNDYQVFPVGWSQDSKQIAFLTSNLGGFIGGNKLCILKLSDKEISIVAKGLSSADWGKNGRFAIADGKNVWLVDQLGRNKVTLNVPTAAAFSGADNVSFSADATKVIYIVAHKYYLHDIKTNTYEELVIPKEAADNGKVFAANDGRIAVIENRKIYIYEPASQSYSLLYQDADSAYANWLLQTGSTKKTSKIKAVYTNSSVMVNGKKVAFIAYNIGGYNYFKLRDVAMVLAESDKQFEVTWDGAKNAMYLIPNKAYTPNGSELAASSDLSSKDASLTTSKIYLNNVEVKLTAYSINGSSYFMLRDIGKAINFNVSWDSKNNAILIDTKADYKE